MIEVKDKSKCCGCTACMNICPKKAIKMIEDEEGFLYPQVDKTKCINCGLCTKICPILNKKISSEIEPRGYVIRSKDSNILKKSTSGGFFTPLAKYVLSKNGVVFGVVYDKKMQVCHISTKESNVLLEMIGSKYVQSNLGDSFSKVKKYLEKGTMVLFSGTPCQIAGLKKYLIKDYENLITMDVICHGTPSPKLWKSYVDFQEKKFKSKIVKAFFRNKTYGYHNGTMKLVFENGREYYGSARVDFMLKSFFKEISSRPSCYDCAFKTRKHCSDFTVFDCWHASHYSSKIKDDDNGYTNLIVNSKKGLVILEAIENDIELYTANLNEQIELDGPMVEHSKNPHPNRYDFYIDLNRLGLEKTIEKYLKIKKRDILFEKSKKILYRSELIKKIKNRW